MRYTSAHILFAVFTGLIASISPTIAAPNTELAFSSYLGGEGTDWVLDITSDDSLNIYLVGISSSRDLLSATPDSCPSSSCHVAYLAKVNGSTFALEYINKFAGTSSELSVSIALDDSGYIYLAGTTESPDYPTLNAQQMLYGGGQSDGYVIKISSDGSTVIWASYLGGSGKDLVNDIAVDPSTGAVYVCGVTNSTDFPLAAEFDPTLSGESEAFVTSFTASGLAIQYSSFYGGNGADTAKSIVYDNGHGAVICGVTTSTDLETDFTYGATDRSTADGFAATIVDIFFVPAHTARIGGSGYDAMNAVAVDSAGRVCVGGESFSDDMRTENAYQAFQQGNGDSYVMFLSQTYDTVIYAGYFGGSNYETISSLGLDDDGYVYFTGEEQSPDIPLLHPYQDFKNGASDAVAVKMNLLEPTLSYSTYCGGWHYQGSIGAHVRSDGMFCVGGITKSDDYPQVNSFQPTKASLIFDGFVSCFTAPTLGDESCCRVAGDTDHSGSVTIGDVTSVISYVFGGGFTPPCLSEADANGSGAITIGDVTYLISHIFAGGSAPICGSPNTTSGG